MDNKIAIQINPGATVRINNASGLKVKGKINKTIKKNRQKLTKNLICRTCSNNSRLNCRTNRFTNDTPDNQRYLRVKLDGRLIIPPLLVSYALQFAPLVQ